MATIPAGYQLHVTTWENDADNYGTEILSGLTAEDVAFYVDLLANFASRNNPRFGRKVGYGNGGLKQGQLEELIAVTSNKHPAISESLKEQLNFTDAGDDDEYIDDRMYEFITDILGSPVNECYCDIHHFVRVFDSYKVIYVPMELEDVTDQFPVP